MPQGKNFYKGKERTFAREKKELLQRKGKNFCEGKEGTFVRGRKELLQGKGRNFCKGKCTDGSVPAPHTCAPTVGDKSSPFSAIISYITQKCIDFSKLLKQNCVYNDSFIFPTIFYLIPLPIKWKIVYISLYYSVVDKKRKFIYLPVHMAHMP